MTDSLSAAWLELDRNYWRAAYIHRDAWEQRELSPDKEREARLEFRDAAEALQAFETSDEDSGRNVEHLSNRRSRYVHRHHPMWRVADVSTWRSTTVIEVPESIADEYRRTTVGFVLSVSGTWHEQVADTIVDTDSERLDRARTSCDRIVKIKRQFTTERLPYDPQGWSVEPHHNWPWPYSGDGRLKGKGGRQMAICCECDWSYDG